MCFLTPYLTEDTAKKDDGNMIFIIFLEIWISFCRK